MFILSNINCSILSYSCSLNDMGDCASLNSSPSDAATTYSFSATDKTVASDATFLISFGSTNDQNLLFPVGVNLVTITANGGTSGDA